MIENVHSYIDINKEVLIQYKEYAYMDKNRIDKLVNGLEMRIDKIKEVQKQRTKNS